jgi:4-amino-4-deoxy-L-arabinose transferase-like glycosyltransferase
VGGAGVLTVAGPRDGLRALRPRSVAAIAATILAIALAVRVAYVLATPSYHPGHDDLAYDRLAIGIARTGAYPSVQHHATAYRPPGYPYLLGAIYSIVGSGHARIVAARLVQAGLGVVSVVLLGLIALWLFGIVAALCAMAITAVYVPWVAAGTSLLSEPLTVLLELAAIAAVLQWRRDRRWRWVVFAGVLGGVLALTRTNAFVVLIALAVGLLWVGAEGGHDGRRRSARALGPPAAMLLIAALVVAPWTVRNAVVMHSFIPISDEAGGTLAGTYNPVSNTDHEAPASWLLLAQIPEYQARTLSVAEGPEPQFQSRLLHLALDYVEQHPLYPAKVAFYNTVRLVDLGGLSLARYTATLSGIDSPVVAEAGVFCFWAVLIAAVGACALPVIRRSVPMFLWLVAALLLASIVLASAETPRLRMPLDPFVILIAGAGLARIAARYPIVGSVPWSMSC